MLIPGTIVERYRVGRLLGRGGMASVYEVRHEVLGTRHALKVLHNTGPRVRERLIREGRMQARLDSAHVVPVTDVLEVHGAPALLMPYVAGCSLDDLLGKYQPTESEVAALFGGVVAGMVAAHNAGIVHRDVKPANVMLEVKRGEVVVRVADFGLGRTDEPDAFETVEGSFLGTPAYASPEQFLDSSSVDARSDLWSLGAMLFELLVGHRPFRGRSVGPIRRAVLEGRYDADVLPEGWREVVSALLQVEPSDRMASARELQARVADMRPPADLLVGSPIAEFVQQFVESAEADNPVPPARSGNTGDTMDPSQFASAHGSHNTFPTIDLEPAAPPTLAPPVSIVHNLPVQRAGLVGRTADLRALKEALAYAPLVSVVGTGGVGKTRLVLEHAWNTLEMWTGGVAFCDVADARRVSGVVAAVARGLGVPLVGDDAVGRLGHAIAGRGRCLVVLDNFEQVAEHAPETLGVWLRRAPDAVFLVTTRALLNLPGETAVLVAPMQPHDSAALFVERATTAKPAFVPTEADHSAIADLVDLLDHLPLAIELAAARVRVAGPQKLLQRMSDRFRVLTSAGGRLERQATLRATLDWSWELLTPWEQGALAQMAVFEGGFDLDAAEAVLDLETFYGAPWAMDVVQALVDQSLVRSLANDRFSLLVSVHEYASEKLGQGDERSAAERRHGEWYAELGTADSLASHARHGGALRRGAVVRDVDNLMVANARARQRGDAEVAVNTALAAWVAVMLTVPLSVGVQILGETLAMPGLTANQQARLGATAGFAAWSKGDNVLAEARYEAALAAARSCGNAVVEGAVLLHQAFVREHVGDTDAAKALFHQALELGRRHGDPIAEGRGLHGLGNLEQLQGDLSSARLHLDEALIVHRRNGDERSEAKALGFRGNLHFQQGRVAEAEADYRAAYAIYDGVGDRRSSSWVLGNIGVIHAERGEMQEAVDTFEAALAVHQEVGDRRTEGVVMGNLGEMYLRLGRRERARHLYYGALGINRQLGNRQFEAIALGAIGAMLREEGELEQAETHLTEALAGIREVGDPWTEGDTLVEMSRLRTAQGRFDEGRAHLADAQPLLRDVGNLSGQAICEVASAELEAAAGEMEAAHEALQRANDLADAAKAGEASPVRLQIAKVDKQLA